MAAIRVLVVDDSALARKLISDALSGDPDIEVVGTAANGKIALDKLRQLKPDVVTLDIEMPELDGLQTLVEIRKAHPKLPVIMCSTLTERGAISTLEALAVGASDYITKPTGSESTAASVNHIRDQLTRRVRALSHAPPAMVGAALAEPPAPRVVVKPARPAPAPAAPAPDPRPAARRPSHAALDTNGVVAIGASTGGPAALSALLPKLVREVHLPIVIVQHMPPVFTAQFAARLATLSGIDVREGADGDVLEAGRAWVAPGDYHMALVPDGLTVRIALNQGPPENSCRPAVDVLFRSVAAAYGRRAIAVVLTGMGQDGLAGAREIRAAGGQVLAQDEASSVVWGMPGALARHNVAHAVLPLDQLDAEVADRARGLPATGRVSYAMLPPREVSRGH
ncbi:MAG: chemotaxis response regulator protein-glutamate methylesterase [Polyangiales bacterium]